VVYWIWFHQWNYYLAVAECGCNQTLVVSELDSDKCPGFQQ